MNEKINNFAVLQWLIEAGADECISDDVANRLELAQSTPTYRLPSAPAYKAPSNISKPKEEVYYQTSTKAPIIAKPQPVKTTSLPIQQSQTSNLEEAINRAKELAKMSNSLEELRENISKFEFCSLKEKANNLVFAKGNPKAKLMVIGEAPGEHEDLEGLPFVGDAGKLLDKMLIAIKQDLSNTYITNILPWRPPFNRTPTLDEMAMFAPFVFKHIELINPKVIMLMGGVASQCVLKTSVGITALRGKWQKITIGEYTIPSMPTFHPSFLLRMPQQKANAWIDLQEVQKALAL
ncbi:MAG: uracil-DNA glycosylase [Alphaproteobacteria bacterium]|nr:uracil-DNA glycosylase [Alphaproteobacteria bacterium]